MRYRLCDNEQYGFYIHACVVGCVLTENRRLSEVETTRKEAKASQGNPAVKGAEKRTQDWKIKNKLTRSPGTSKDGRLFELSLPDVYYRSNKCAVYLFSIVLLQKVLALEPVTKFH